MILRCTGKVLALLGVGDVVAVPSGEDDWYLNLVWLDGRKCLLLTHAGTLFPVLVPDVRKADLRPLGQWLSGVIRTELRSEGLANDALGFLAMDELVVAKTASRSVLGFMTEMALHAELAVADAGGLALCDVAALNHRLRRSLHNRGSHYATALELLTARLNPAGRSGSQLTVDAPNAGLRSPG